MAWNDELEEGTPAHTFAASTSTTVRAVAGPGSGKSFAIGRRIARLIGEGVAPERILAITFTRTAAKDLRDDISALTIEGSERVVARTVHSHALSILMRANVIEHTERVPRMILDHEIAPALRDLNNPSFGGVNNKKALKDAYLAAWATLQTDEPGFAHDEVQQQFQNELIAWMKYHAGMLVGEVIPVAIEYLRFNPASDAIGAYDAILVDEYQDLNKAEQELIHLIRGEAGVVVVGDDDQSIYGFKFAHPEGIRSIHELHGECEDIPFAECRRCPTNVTTMASRLIGHNTDRTLGELTPRDGNPAGRINIVQWTTWEDENDGLVAIIADELSKQDVRPEDVLILTQRRRIGYRIRDTLNKNGVPARSYFRESAIDKRTSQRVYSLLVASAKSDDIVSWRYLLGATGTNFRNTQYAKLRSAAKEADISVLELLQQMESGEIALPGTSHVLAAYKQICEEIERIRALVKGEPRALFGSLFIVDDETADQLSELNDIYERLLDDRAPFEGSSEEFDAWFRELVEALQQEVTNPVLPDKFDHVRIMSLHSSKGLSAKFVVVCGLIDELIPGRDPTAAVIEEQRRLLYVAVTRCKCSDTYDGRLLLSSFLSLPGEEALNMGIAAKAGRPRKVRATRFIADFGQTAPAPVRGETLLNQ